MDSQTMVSKVNKMNKIISSSDRAEDLFHVKKRPTEILLYGAVYISAAFSVFLIVGIILYVIAKGHSMVSISFLTSVSSILKGTVGIAGNIINTLYIIILTIIMVTPFGIGAAVYLNEYAKPGKLVSTIEFATQILAGIPSIIFGLFGRVFFGVTLKLGYSLLTGAFTLAIMVLPLVIRNTQEALKTVPDSYRHGAIGLGTGKWYMIRTILIPSAMPGIITGVILAIGRIVGESAALLFTAGSANIIPKGFSQLLHKALESGGTLTIQLYLSMADGKYDVAFGTALVLLVIVLGVNFLAKYIAKKFDVNTLD